MTPPVPSIPSLDTAALLDLISATDEDLTNAGTALPPRLLEMRRLNACAEIVKRRNNADDDVAEAVRRMRARGASWSDIALALNVSKQAAHQRYSYAVLKMDAERALAHDYGE